MKAASKGHVTCLQPLIDAKCDLHKADDYVTSSTHKACVLCICVVLYCGMYGYSSVMCGAHVSNAPNHTSSLVLLDWHIQAHLFWYILSYVRSLRSSDGVSSFIHHSIHKIPFFLLCVTYYAILGPNCSGSSSRYEQDGMCSTHPRSITHVPDKSCILPTIIQIYVRLLVCMFMYVCLRCSAGHIIHLAMYTCFLTFSRRGAALARFVGGCWGRR